MNDEKIVLVARLIVKEGTADEAKKLALSLVEPSRAEAGCINYDIHQSIEDGNVFIWHETWTNTAAIHEHFEKPFFTEFFAKIQEIAAEPPQINLTRMISEK